MAEKPKRPISVQEFKQPQSSLSQLAIKALTLEQITQREQWTSEIEQSEATLKNVPANIDPAMAIQEADRNFEKELKQQLRSQIFHRVDADDAITVDSVIRNTENEDFRIKSLIREVILSKSFAPSR